MMIGMPEEKVLGHFKEAFPPKIGEQLLRIEQIDAALEIAVVLLFSNAYKHKL